MQKVAWEALVWASWLLSIHAAARPLPNIPATSVAKPSQQTQAKPAATVSHTAGYDQLLSDINMEKDPELRLARYWEFANNNTYPQADRKVALEKWQQLFERRLASAALLANAKLSESQSGDNWDQEEKLFQKSIETFPSSEPRALFSQFLLRRAMHEMEMGNSTNAAVLIGRAHELGANESSVKSAREELQAHGKKQRLFSGIEGGAISFWRVITAVLGSAQVWALVGIIFVFRLYHKLRGNKNDYQFEPFIVVQQHDSDVKERIYPSLTSRLLKEMQRVKEIHQGSSQKPLDEISDPLGYAVPINFTEYEPELTSKIEQIPELSVGGVKISLASYLAILLRVNAKRVRTYYEEFTSGGKTGLRLIADMRGTRALVVDNEYMEVKHVESPPPATKPVRPTIFSFFFGHRNDNRVAQTSDDLPPSHPPKAEVLDRLITKLACEVRFSMVVDANRRRRGTKEGEYSKSASAYREFTLGLDAQHQSAQLRRHNESAASLAAVRSKLLEAREHYSNAIAEQSDHAAAYFCRAGISLQEAQVYNRDYLTGAPKFRSFTIFQHKLQNVLIGGGIVLRF